MGEPVRWSALGLRWAALTLVMVIGAAAVLVSQLQYAEKITVDGWVDPPAKPVIVRSDTAARVTNVKVASEDWVRSGQPMLLLDKRAHTTDGRSYTQLRVAQLSARKASLDAARAHADAVFEQQRSLLLARLHGRQQLQDLLGEQVGLLRQRVALAESHWQQAQRLRAQGWLSDRDAAEVESRLLLVREALLTQQRQVQATHTAAVELRAELKLHAAEERLQRGRRIQELQQLEHDIEQVQAAQRSMIVAPIAGRVADLVVTVGQRVEVGQPLITLAPETAQQHGISVFLSSAAAGRVRPGAPIRVRYHGYPHQEYGSASGRIKRVSDVAERAAAGAGFRAEIEIDSVPDGINHIPAGMAVSADILLDQRPLWRWLLQPLADAMARL